MSCASAQSVRPPHPRATAVVPEWSAGRCPYGCVGGWLPVPNHEGRIYYPVWSGGREWWTLKSTYHGGIYGESHRLGEEGRCVDCRAAAPPREPDLFAEETPCPFCDDSHLLDDDEPEVGFSFEAAVRLLEGLGARPHEHLFDFWSLTLNGLEHEYRLVELGADTWQIKPLTLCPDGCCWKLAPPAIPY
jgi:hypothetical protein